MSDATHTLHIYKASAGSGKTHQLTGFYINLLFNPAFLPPTREAADALHPREILAVTFTNKATAEMKARITAELFTLMQYPERSVYWFSLHGECHLSPTKVQERARQLLIEILNDYSSFYISTIDSFFQKIVRSFARECSLPAGFELELDANRVLEAAVTAFLGKLGQDRAVYQWVRAYALSQMEEGKSWDIRGQLTAIARRTFESETYSIHSTEVRTFTQDTKRLNDYRQSLTSIIQNWRGQLRDLGQEGIDLLRHYDYRPADFKYKGVGSVSFFEVWQQGIEKTPGVRAIEMVDTPEKYAPKKASDDFLSALSALFDRAKTLFTDTAFFDYKTALSLHSQLYALGLISYIDQERMNYCQEKNIMLLNSSTELLSHLITQDDAPFIYEKMGNRLCSYMIDEFQDTSGLQWGNFRPLISNAIAEGYHNLIVGDVKQSIYRWRGGDFNLLGSQLNDYERSAHEECTLTKNWRSLPHVVTFNNEYFSWLASWMDRQFPDQPTYFQPLYQDVQQEWKQSKATGLVHLAFLEPKDEEGNVLSSPHKEDYLNEAASGLMKCLIKLQECGYAPGDIAVLCRYNRECVWAAETILQYKNDHPTSPYSWNILSNEALLIGSRQAPRVVLSALQLIANPTSELTALQLWCDYYTLAGLTVKEAITTFFSDEPHETFPAELMEAEADKAQTLATLATLPLYELTSTLIARLRASQPTVLGGLTTTLEKDQPFLDALSDTVLEYTSREGSDLTAFLTWWNDAGCKKTLTTPDSHDAIQIMTIHKSKGLGMPAVVMPFCSWPLDIDTTHRDELLWCTPKNEPFYTGTVLPVALSQQLKDTYFCEEYVQERRQAIIDGLNTTYVAFTRAKEALVILAPAHKKKDEPALTTFTVEDTLSRFYEQNPQYVVTFEDDWTNYLPAKLTTAKPAPNKLQPAVYNLSTSHTTFRPLPKINERHKENDTLARDRGTLFHALLQQIKTYNDVSDTVRRFYQQHAVDTSLLPQAETFAWLRQLLSLPQVRSWFSPDNQIINELSIVDAAGHTHRPDRVVVAPDRRTATVIDYKTGKAHAEYAQQVDTYRQLLLAMGFSTVNAYLLYVDERHVEEVK